MWGRRAGPSAVAQGWNPARFDVDGDGVRLSGSLVRETVPRAYDDWHRLLATRAVEHVDASGLDALDSAGLALLVVMARAGGRSRGVRIHSVPTQFSGVLRLYHLDQAFADNTLPTPR